MIWVKMVSPTQTIMGLFIMGLNLGNAIKEAKLEMTE